MWLWCCIALIVPVLATQVQPIASAQSSISFSSIPLQSWRVNGEGRAVLKVGNVVYVGGTFTRATSPDSSQSADRYNLAAFDAQTGALISSFRADTDGRVYDLATDGTSLFVSGSFNTIGGVSRGRIAALDLATGAVRTGFRADAGSTVYSMSIAAGKLYVSGVFTNINGVGRSRVGAVDLTTGAVDGSFAPNANGTVRAIAAMPDGSTVYVGGTYSQINNVNDTDISTLDGVTGARTGPELSGVTGYVDDLEVTPDGQRLLAAHSGVPGVGNRTAVYDTATGNRQWRQVVDGDVQGLHLIGDMVYAGFHDGAKGDGASRVAGYTLSGGTEDAGFHPSFDRFMGAWSVHGDAQALVIAGNFSIVSGVRVEGFAIFPAAPPTPFAAAKWGWESWQYLDNGTDQGTAWREPGFNDSSWKSGIGEFGYSNGGERTKLSYGPSWSNKYITTYFRTTFDASTVPESAAIYMRVDDGAVVYVNGIEAARDNIAAGAVNHLTLATDRSGNSEGSSRYFAIDPALIVPGSNTLAVEIHQSSPSSDDLKFFATFVAYGESDGNLLPVGSIALDPAVGVAPLPVAFDGSGSTDADGSIVDWAWDFGDGTTASGVTAAHTYIASGAYTVTLRVTDDGGAVGATSRVVTVTEPPPADRVVDVAPTANWLYLDDGSSLGAEWTLLDYDAAGWSTGVGEFGYGDGDENTVVSYGPSAGQKFNTTYFRTLFVASAVPTALTLSLRVDDGAVVYLNGTEVTRFNLPPGAISSATAATDAIYGSAEIEDRIFTIDPALVQSGPNVLAVEVHQNTRGSSDLSFLASLIGIGDEGPPPPPPPVNDPPVAVAVPAPQVGEAPLPVMFDGTGSTDADGIIVSWAWDFGDGTTDTGVTAAHEYTDPGVYMAVLTVTDDLGGVATTTVQVTATDPNPPPPPPGVTVDVAPTATWSYSDLGDVVGPDWATLGYDDAAWATGVGEFGFGDGDEATIVSYGPSAGQKYRTTYFRTSFTAPGAPDDLALTLRVDDGAVVYLNGVEAARFNLPAGPVSYGTAAPDAIYGSGERIDRAFVLDPTLVLAGDNVLAVEVHQNTLGSSDLSFLASLTGTGVEPPPPPPPPTTTTSLPPTTTTTTSLPPTTTTTLPPPTTTMPATTTTTSTTTTTTTTTTSTTTTTTLPPPPADPVTVVDLAAAASWSYFDGGDTVAPTWADPGFDASTWASGVGEFGYGDGDETTIVSYGPTAGRKYNTTYFRTSFTAAAVPTALELTLRVDDGALVYINGVEAARFNLPAGPVDYLTKAPAAIYGSAELLDRSFVIDPSLVVAGSNVIAVEVHQNTRGSSDLSFLAALFGTA